MKLGLAQTRAGLTPTNEVLVPGVLTYKEYLKRRKMWDKVRQCIGLDAQFFEGGELLLFPPEWLNAAEKYELSRPKPNNKLFPRFLGVDTAEGGDDTAWVVGDEHGVLDVESYPTADTSVIAGRTRTIMRKWVVPPENVYFDRGGGGKFVADQLRAHHSEDIRTISFGDGVSEDLEESRDRRGKHDMSEQRSVYKNMRAQLYGEASQLFDPTPLNIEIDDSALKVKPHAFALPPKFAELRRQLAPMPRSYDGEGRQYLIPKNKPTPTYKGPTIRDLIGRSPDQADAFVLMCHGICRWKNDPQYVVLSKPEETKPQQQFFPTGRR